MNTRQGTRNGKRRESISPSVGPVSDGSLDSSVTMFAVEQALAELGIHASLSAIAAKAQSIEKRIIQSRSRRKMEHVC